VGKKAKMSEAQLLFGVAVSMIFYGFAGYPLLLFILSSLAPRKQFHGEPDHWPAVTLLISAYNEEAVIEAKIENGLQLDYPREKLEIMVVSDGSTDQTDAIVRLMAEKSRVRLLRQPVRRGKSAALNEAVTAAGGEIIVFSDANSFYEQQAIRELTRPFQDRKVGLVTGCTRYMARVEGALRESTGLYSKLELWTKRYESRIHSCVGADGAIFACRKHLFQPLREDDINDLVVPFQVVRQGYRVILNENAYCLEEGARLPGNEFQRQVRIACRTLHGLGRYKAVWNPFRQPLFSFMVISHKVLKLLLPFFMILALATNLVLASSTSFAVLLLLQAGGYLLALWGGLTGRGRGASLAFSLCLTSLAFLLGWRKWLMGETFTTWTPGRA
jgi:cellulose synthase/poly-beta-1,6-N-acetylglucosamine synthase-like glycosyltransferase